MSMYFGYYCITCDQSTGHHVNHGKEKLIRFVDRFDELIAVQHGIDSSFQDYVSLDWHWPYFDFFEFVEKHRGHKLAIENEYGERIPL